MATAALALILVWTFRGNRVPIVSDEIGYISISKYLLTGEKITLWVMPSYRFGQALLLAPIFALPISDETAYQLVVCVNCVQTALIPLVLIGIGARVGIKPSWRVCAAAVLATLFPSYLYHVSLAWPEVAFRLWFLIVVYLVASAWATQKVLFWYLLAISCVWLFSLHGRAIGLFPAFLILVYFGWRKEKLSLLNAVGLVTVMAALAFAVWHFQKHVELELWGSAASEVRRGLANIIAPDGARGFAAALIGQAWSQTAASFGLVLVGIAASWKISTRGGIAMPVFAFALLSLGIGAVASAVQLATLDRVDHLIYSRYNDGFTTLFVWLGLSAVIAPIAPLKRAGLVIGVITVALGTLALVGAPDDLSGMVTPNIPAFLWVDYLVPIQSASALQIIAIVSIGAIAVGSLVYLRPGVVAALILLLAVGSAGFIVKRRALSAHHAREYFVDQGAKEYARVGGTIYWDQSVIHDLNLMFDQYSAIGALMPVSDLATEDIPTGAGAVVSLDFKKAGYSCVGRLLYDAKLVIRSSATDAC